MLVVDRGGSRGGAGACAWVVVGTGLESFAGVIARGGRAGEAIPSAHVGNLGGSIDYCFRLGVGECIEYVVVSGKYALRKGMEIYIHWRQCPRALNGSGILNVGETLLFNDTRIVGWI